MNSLTENRQLQWFPMRVTYNRELLVKEHLDMMNIENFLPVKPDLKLTDDGWKKVMVPAIHNLLFVRSDKETITHLKMTRKEFEPMRYMMHSPINGGDKYIISVPDEQMNNFIRVASYHDDNITFLEMSLI